MRVTPDKTIDEEFELLGTEGYTGSINDRIMSYLGDLGRTGAISDRFGATEDELLNIELGNLFPKPKCKDGDGWTDQNSVSTNLTDDALDYFPGVSVASGGGPSHRLIDNQTVNVTNGTNYFVRVFCKEGTSGEIRITLRNDVGGTVSLVSGQFGSVTASATQNAGTASNVSEVAVDGITVIDFNFTPNADYDLQLGIGPDSSTTGETVVAYGVHMEEIPVNYLEGIETNNLLSLPKCVDGNGWEDIGSTTTSLSDNALGFFPGVSVASQGASFHRLIDSQTVNIVNGSTYSVKVFYKEGTSGKCRINLRNVSAGEQSGLVGDVGELAVSFSNAGAFADVVQKVVSGVHIVEFTFTPNASYELEFGIGPNSTTSGETVTAYGAIIREAS